MGSCLTKCSGDRVEVQQDDRYNLDDLAVNTSGDINQTNEYDEELRKKSRHLADGGGVGGSGDRGGGLQRRSSGLSRYSQDGRHVIHPPCSIGAFNIQKFGMAKLSDKDTLEIIARLVREFDILLVQEVVDVSGKALNLLLEEVNSVQLNGGVYEVLASPRVGRTKNKEQYAIFYKTSLVQILDSKIYHDPGDLFIREPFIVSVSVDTVCTVASQFCLVCIHTQPSSANLEIDGLVDVKKHVTDTWQMDNVIILGDLNASGPYIKSRDWDTNRLRGSEYNWLIPDHMDTTATNTLAAYDRIIVCGPMMGGVVQDSAQVFRYDQQYQISQDALKKVSDHYPVRFSLQTVAHPKVQKNITTKTIISVEDKRFITTNSDQFLNQFNLKRFKAVGLYTKSGELASIEIKSQRFSQVASALACIEYLRKYDRSMVSYSLLASVKHQMNYVVSSWDKELLAEGKGKFQVNVLVDVLEKKIVCSISIIS